MKKENGFVETQRKTLRHLLIQVYDPEEKEVK